MAQFEEPPALQDSEGNPIVQFRRPDGTIFSNHPEYGYAKAVHEQQQLREAEAAGEVEDDEAQEPDDGDGTTSYEEMTSHDLAELVRKRDLKGLPDRKRSTIIKALQDDDAKNAEASS